MIKVIASLSKISDRLDKLGRSDLADIIDKIASYTIEAYRARFRRPKRFRGQFRIKRKRYYRVHMPSIRRRQRMYRLKHRTQLRRRRRLRHYHRFG